MSETIAQDAQRLLGQLTGDPGATFRDGQLEAIAELVEGRRRVLVVQRTGWGKSAVYFLATRLLRDRGAGASILISPLLALMRNQVEMGERAGVRAVTINSSNRDEWAGVESAIRAGEVDLVLVSPERLNNPRFRSDVLPDLVRGTGLLIVDEAHCISDWGHDFRPDYRRVSRVIDLLPPTTPVLCTTATANARVVDDIVEQLGGDLVVHRGALERESLQLAVVPLPTPAQRLAWLAQVVPQLPGSGIVYCLTVADAARVTAWLKRNGVSAMSYSGEAETEDRLVVERALAANEVKVVVATSALGMGYDKPDLGFVVHYQHPGSPVAYYQQVGRAGRAIATSHGILLVGAEDVDIQDFFISTAFPSREHTEQVLALLGEGGAGASVRSLLSEVNLGQTRVEAMLKILEVEGAVARVEGGGWARTGQAWEYDEERVQSVTAVRRAEQAAMRAYVSHDGCLMAFLRHELDDPDPSACGRCAGCTGHRWPGADDLDPAAVQAAVDFLRSQAVVIEPRRQWMNVNGLKGNIAPGMRAEPGRALGLANDGAWGSVVRSAVRNDEPVSDRVLDAAVGLIARWAPEPAPTWVTWVPTGGRVIVEDLARRLAERLGLPAVAAIERIGSPAAQRELSNSAQQLRNVHGAFVVPGTVPDEPVLLVDDVFDSRWTLTVVASELRYAGVPAVHPFVLSRA